MPSSTNCRRKVSVDKRALIVSPYLDHLGGGERYMLTVASTLAKLGCRIFFAWDDAQQITDLAHMLGIELGTVELHPAVKPLYLAHNPLGMYSATRGYDVVVYLSDGSLPLLGGRKNILHMQVPFHDVGGHSLKNQLKKICLHAVIVNSQFTKKIVDQEFGIRSTVLFPPVQLLEPGLHKSNIILSVGRFEPSLNAKKQDILIEAWSGLASKLPGWELVLAGASSSDDWIAQLKQKAHGLPIRFALNISHQELTDLYHQSRVYWHAAGFGVDESKNPELTEHFGISVVEAISAGVIPLVVGRGGLPEIVSDPSLQWVSLEELRTKTLAVLAASDPTPYLAKIDLTRYSQAAFSSQLKEIIL